MSDFENTQKSEIFLPGRQLVKWTLAIYFSGLVIFSATSAERLLKHSPDNHYVYLADAMLHGRLHIDGNPPHRNDWAKYDGKWFVSFPPAPAVLMIPGVALFGMQFNDRLFTLLFAAAGPALLFLILAALARRRRIDRKPWEAALLSALYGLGTVYYFSAVQGSVWYTAHMVGGVFLLLFILASIDARHPVLAGLSIGIAFACRPSFLPAAVYFVYEAVTAGSAATDGIFYSLKRRFRELGVWGFVKPYLAFGLPIVAIIAGILVMNAVRYDNPLEFGHGLLKVRWTGRIEKWGLFNFHFLARNLAVAGTLLPWVSTSKPYLQISNHGLALWFTTPVLLYILYPKVISRFYWALVASAAAVAVPTLLYQNSGWVQFGYRFALDYMPFLILLIAAGGRRFTKIFYALCVWSLIVNLFGAITFDRIKAVFPRKAPTAYFEPD